MNPNEASDHIEITGLLARYAWAIDGRRPDLFAAVFTPDIEADYGPFGSFSDLVTLANRFDEYHAQFATTQHMITNAFIEVDGDTATCRSYFQATMVYLREDDQETDAFERQSFRGGGYKEDELVRTAPGRRIAKRACIGAWFTPAPELIFPGAEELAVPQ
jgi:SnoaL-like domain